jgi:hypothetical protein
MFQKRLGSITRTLKRSDRRTVRFVSLSPLCAAAPPAWNRRPALGIIQAKRPEPAVLR